MNHRDVTAPAPRDLTHLTHLTPPAPLSQRARGEQEAMGISRSPFSPWEKGARGMRSQG